MDDDTRSKAQDRLKRIAGQVTGIQRMVEADRYCVDVLHQIAAAQAALMEAGRVVLAGHVENCLADAIRGQDERERQKKIKELIDLFSRFCRIGDSSAEPRGVPSNLKAKSSRRSP